jgi:hypothetical protein
MLKISRTPRGLWQVVREDTGHPVPFMFAGDEVPSTTFRTLEEAQIVLEERLQTPYYEALRDWLRSLRVCGLCSVHMAAAKIERWAGRPAYDWKAKRGDCMGVPCRACPQCVAGASCPHPLNCESLSRQHADKQPPPPCDHPNNPKPAKAKAAPPSTRAASAVTAAA